MLDIIGIEDEKRTADDIIDFGKAKTELEEMLPEIKKIKRHQEIFSKACSDVIIGLGFVLESLATSKYCPEELLTEMKDICKKFIDM